MTLPQENEAQRLIAAKYGPQLATMTSLHDAVVKMLEAEEWTIDSRKKRGLDTLVVETMIGLLTKASKTFRAIQILCQHGLYEDANSLIRVLMETVIAVAFILQKKSKERARIYHAYVIAQNLKMLNEWKQTPGLKRQATKKMLKRTTDELAARMKELPPRTNVKNHWSGTVSLQQAMKALRGDVMYATLFRFTSSISHASDPGAHFEIDPNSGARVWLIAPGVDGLESPALVARELL